MVEQPQKYDKRVLVIGGGFAGMTIAERLWNHAHVTLIDKKDHFEYFVTNIKILVKDNDFGSISIPFEEIRTAHNNAFDFVQGALTIVNKDDTITITKDDGST